MALELSWMVPGTSFSATVPATLVTEIAWPFSSRTIEMSCPDFAWLVQDGCVDSGGFRGPLISASPTTFSYPLDGKLEYRFLSGSGPSRSNLSPVSENPRSANRHFARSWSSLDEYVPSKTVPINVHGVGNLYGCGLLSCFAVSGASPPTPCPDCECDR